VAFVDQGYTGDTAAQQASEHAIQLEVVKHTEAKKGFVLETVSKPHFDAASP
jgi:hypothetical protein